MRRLEVRGYLIYLSIKTEILSKFKSCICYCNVSKASRKIKFKKNIIGHGILIDKKRKQRVVLHLKHDKSMSFLYSFY